MKVNAQEKRKRLFPTGLVVCPPTDGRYSSNKIAINLVISTAREEAKIRSEITDYITEFKGKMHYRMLVQIRRDAHISNVQTLGYW
jgi:hypothetical protein